MLVGSVNPAIFSPYWLRQCELVTDQEAAAAEVGLISPEATQILVADFQLIANRDRFQIETTVAPWVRLLDFAAKLFGEVLPHTPILQLGINRTVHFKVKNEEVRNAIGRKLAPLEPWGDWGKDLAKGPLRGGLQTVAMAEPWEDEPFAGRVTTTLQPSGRIPGNAGIYMQINNHCQFQKEDVIESTAKMIDFLIRNFEKSIAKSDAIVDQIMSLQDS